MGRSRSQNDKKKKRSARCDPAHPQHLRRRQAGTVDIGVVGSALAVRGGGPWMAWLLAAV
jgi:hypothetical protein